MASEFLSQHLRIVVVAVLCSFVLSAWCVWADPVINNDGIHYLRSANSILAGSWREAITIYSWPFYPALISVVSKLSGAGVLTSAHLLNALLGGVLVAGFLAVVFEFGGDRKTLIVAAVVILAFPTLNKYRPFVIRDLGYVACYLWSLVFLFRYWRNKQKIHMLWWICGAVAACLFRAEGIAMLVAIPIVIFTITGYRGSSGWRMVLLYMTGGTLLLAVLTVWLYRDFAILTPGGGVENPADMAGKIGDYLDRAVGSKLKLLKDQFTDRYYVIVYAMIVVSVTLAEVVRRLAVVYALLALWGLKKKILFPEPSVKLLWLGVIAINIVVLIGSALFKSFVVDRYALAVSVTILLASPFVLVDLGNRWKTSNEGGRRKWVFPTVIVTCLWLSIRGLDVFTDKQFIAEAGRWINENSAAGSTLHSNNMILIFYSGKNAYHESGSYSWRYTYDLIKRKDWKNYDHVAIALRAHDQRWIEWLDEHLDGPAIQKFSNDKGDVALIYETRG